MPACCCPMVPGCYMNQAGSSGSLLLCCEGLKLEMPVTVNAIDFSAVTLPGSSAAPVDDGSTERSQALCICVFGEGPNLRS